MRGCEKGWKGLDFEEGSTHMKSGKPKMPVPHVVRPATVAAPKMQHQGGKDVTRARHRPPWSTAATHTTGPRIPDQHALLDRRAWLSQLGAAYSWMWRQAAACCAAEGGAGASERPPCRPTPSARRHPVRQHRWQEDKGSLGGPKGHAAAVPAPFRASAGAAWVVQ